MDLCYKKTDAVISGLVGDEAVLVPVKNNAGEIEGVFNLNAVGARVWELINGKRDYEAIITKLLEEYEVDRKVLEADLKDFFKQLKQRGWIEAVNKKK